MIDYNNLKRCSICKGLNKDMLYSKVTCSCGRTIYKNLVILVVK